MKLNTTAIDCSEALHGAMLGAKEKSNLRYWACWMQVGRRTLYVSDCNFIS